MPASICQPNDHFISKQRRWRLQMDFIVHRHGENPIFIYP